MAKYAILDNAIGSAGVVRNLAVADEPANPGWIELDLNSNVSKGWLYDGQDFSAPVSTVPIFFSANENITVDGAAAQGAGNTFYGEANVTSVFSADIVDEQGIIQQGIDQTALGYPPLLKLPVVKMVGGVNGHAVDEVYFNTTIVEGVLTATGTLPASGDWKLLTERLNQALAAIGAHWRIDRPNINILV